MPIDLLVSAVGLLILYIYTAARGANKTESFYLTALASHLTGLGELNISIALILLASILLLVRKAAFSSKSFVLFLLLCAIAFGLTFLSTENSARPLNAIGRAVKIILIFFPLFLILKTSTRTTLIFLKGFVFSAALMLLPAAFLMKNDEGYLGTIRVTSFYADANYFALLSLVLYTTTSKFKHIKLQKNTLLLFIVMSQSVTMITATVIALTLPKLLTPSIKATRALPAVIALSYIAALYWVGSFYTVSIIDTSGPSFSEMKLNSVYFRIIAQISALQYATSDASIFWFGYGSGHSVELFGRVLHNAYLQILFDSGILILSLACILIGISAPKKIRHNAPLIIILFSALLFDPFFMYIYTIWLFIENTDSKSKLHAKKPPIQLQSGRFNAKDTDHRTQLHSPGF